MLDSLALPVRSAVGGGQVAAGGQPGSDKIAITVLSWPALVAGGFAIGVVEMPIWLLTGLADTVTLGSFDVVPDTAKALTLASVRPRFLQPTGTTPESCVGRR